MTYFGYFVLVFGQDGEKIGHYFFLIFNEFSCSEVHVPCLCN